MAFDKVDRVALVESCWVPPTTGHPTALYWRYWGPLLTLRISHYRRREKRGSEFARGIKQGCPLSFYLFDIPMTCLMAGVDNLLELSHCPRNASSWARACYDLEYADATVLTFTPSRSCLQFNGKLYAASQRNVAMASHLEQVH